MISAKAIAAQKSTVVRARLASSALRSAGVIPCRRIFSNKSLVVNHKTHAKKTNIAAIILVDAEPERLAGQDREDDAQEDQWAEHSESFRRK